MLGKSVCGLLLFIIIIVTLFGCTNTEDDIAISNWVLATERSEVVTTATPELSLNSEYWPTKSLAELVDSIKDNTKLWDEIGGFPICGIIFNSILFNGEEINFMQLTNTTFDANLLLWIDIKDGKIVEWEKTGAMSVGHLEYYFIEMSQGMFIAAYCADTHANGNLLLIPLDNLGESKYTFSNVYDYNLGFWGVVGEEFGLYNDYGSPILAADILIDKKLDAKYMDIDGDGNTDVVFTGIREIYLNEDDPQLWREYYVKQVYLYDPDIDDFVLSDELSQQVLINEY
jgi:hypothetical protein